MFDVRLYMWVVILLLIAPVTFVNAADSEAMAKAKFMLRQASAENSQLKSENQKLLADNKALEKQLAELEKKYSKLADRSEKAKSAMGNRVDSLNDKLTEVLSSSRETELKLKQTSQEKQQLLNMAATQTEKMELCISNNHRLYEINQELLGKYENKGIWSVLSQEEPFTGLKQVEIENLVDDYQYRMDDLRVNSPEQNQQTSL